MSEEDFVGDGRQGGSQVAERGLGPLRLFLDGISGRVVVIHDYPVSPCELGFGLLWGCRRVRRRPITSVCLSRPQKVSALAPSSSQGAVVGRPRRAVIRVFGPRWWAKSPRPAYPRAAADHLGEDSRAVAMALTLA